MSAESEYGAAEFLCFEVIRQMENRGREVMETSFNKLCSLVHQEVSNEHEVDLPLKWYQYGNVVDLRFLNADFLRHESGDWGTRGTRITIDDIASSAFELSADTREAITDAAQSLANQFQYSYSTEEIKDFSYETQAPNEFIIVMNEFRSHLDSMDAQDAAARDEYVPNVDVSFEDIFGATEERTGSSEIDDDELRSYLTELTEAFPEDTYPHMSGAFYRWQAVCRSLIRYNLYGELREFQKEFWRAMSRAELRIKHSENIPPGQLRRWIEEREEHIEEFEQRLEAKEAVIRKQRDDEGVLNQYASSFDTAVQSVYDRLTARD